MLESAEVGQVQRPVGGEQSELLVCGQDRRTDCRTGCVGGVDEQGPNPPLSQGSRPARQSEERTRATAVVAVSSSPHRSLLRIHYALGRAPRRSADTSVGRA